MDKALEDALRWFLDKELTVEIYAVQSRIDGCYKRLNNVTDVDKRVQREVTLEFHKATHGTLTKLWLALREQSGETE